LLVGGFLDWNVQPTNIDVTSIATVTKSLIFTTVICFHYGVPPGSPSREQQQTKRQQHGNREGNCLSDGGRGREVLQVCEMKDQVRDGEQQVRAQRNPHHAALHCDYGDNEYERKREIHGAVVAHEVFGERRDEVHPGHVVVERPRGQCRDKPDHDYHECEKPHSCAKHRAGQPGIHYDSLRARCGK
jgi:hypothetical protein